MQKLINIYNSINEANRLNSDRARNIEFVITTKIIGKYLRSGDKILDLGSGPGKYAIHYNSKGHTVHASDIVPSHISKLQTIISQNDLLNITCSVNNATDLSFFETGSFDFVFLLGPYYHLKMSDDRKTCINECIRVLKPNGMIAIAYLNIHFTKYYLAKYNKFITKNIFEHISQTDVKTSTNFDDFIDISFLTTPVNIENEINSNGLLNILDHAGVDGINSLISNELNNMTDAQWAEWCEIHYQSCRDKSILGLSSHGLLICQKEKHSRN